VILLSVENTAVAALVKRPSLKDAVQEDRVIVEKSKPAEGNSISIMLFASSGVARVIEILYVPSAEAVIADVLEN
jgi:hypothetical protein